MSKMKTKSGAKKRFRVTANGKVKAKAAYMRHMQMNKPKSMKRKAGVAVLSEPDQKIILDNHMPYQRKNRKKSAARKAAAAARKAGGQ